MPRVTILLLATLAVAGCKSHIGDSCSNSNDCSPNASRQCDLAQPGGYCTVFACDADTCPEGACVEWRFIPSRTAETWCMKTCDTDNNCRIDYSCVPPAQITMDGELAPTVLPPDERVARIIDLDTNPVGTQICAALTPVSNPDASTEPGPDAGL